MNVLLIILAIIIFTCVFLNKLSERMGVPVLLFFILFGMLVGMTDPNAITNYGWLIGDICSIALIFVMFYGGFGTRWSSARPVIAESALLASAGVFITAATIGLFCHYTMGWNWIEALLMGSVICSTDAASVFSILRTRHLGLKRNTSPILEIESGSNDPCSYMLTAICLSLLKSNVSGGEIVWMIVAQITFGLAFGFIIAKTSSYILRKQHFSNAGIRMLFIFAVAIASYAIPSSFGGNGYLSTYIVGIILGNTEFPDRKPLTGFFDGLTSLMEITIFFLLGFMSVPQRLLSVLLPALIIFCFITFAARPIAVFATLLPFRKHPINQMSLISFVGLRGAASIVFAIMTLTGTDAGSLTHDIFSIVFVIVLLSISLQGSLIPFASRKMKMVDTSGGEQYTFSNVSESQEVVFGKIFIDQFSPWLGKNIINLGIPKELLVVTILREGGVIIPDGSTTVELYDEVILGIREYDNTTNALIRQKSISPSSRWVGSTMRSYSAENKDLVILIKRGNRILIPDGSTIICGNDILLYIKRNHPLL